MSRDEIMQLLQECGFGTLMDYPTMTEKMMRFGALVASAEREAIGNIILDYAGRGDLSDSDESLLKHLFELIRARNET